MSTTYHLGCEKCKKQIWIGQGSIIYTGMPEVMDLLKKFLYKHVTHPLTFREDDYFFTEEWTEVEPPTPPPITHSMGLLSMAGLNPDAYNYEQRKVARYGTNDDDLIIDTAYCSDTGYYDTGYYETGIIDKRYYNSWIIVDEYKTKKAALKGHKKWVATMTRKKPPKILTDIHINEDYPITHSKKV